MYNDPYKNAVSVLLAAVAGAVLMILAPAASYGQEIVPENDLFATTTLEKHLQREFRLTPHDIRRLHPLIKRENEKVVLTFGHYTETESENFLSLWNGVRTSRGDFESGLAADLTARQKNALRAARSEFELRILTQWTGDYLASLADYLDLDTFQVSCVRKVFEDETEKRYQLIVSGAKQDADWQKLTDERERYLSSILTPIQVREYHSRNMPVQKLLA